MMERKIPGACTLCNERCFEVLQANDSNEKNPGEPKRLGKPNEDATRITFLLYDGSNCSMTFCGACASKLNHGHYTPIWKKVIAAWLPELKDNRPPWFIQQLQNGLLCELNRTNWKELCNGSS